jgi:hypothetical protein
MITSSDSFYQSADLSLCSTLSLFIPIDSIYKVGTKGFFLFKRDDYLDKLLESYWRQELRVEPQAYFNQLKILKSRLYSE